MASQHNDPDILERAVSELRRQGESSGPAPEALARAREAMRAAQRRKPGSPLAERIRHMNRLRKPLLISAAAAVVVIAIGVWMFLPSGGKSGMAFADVRQQIEQAQTMTVTATTEMEMKGIHKPMTMKMKMYFKSPGLMRQEMLMQGLATTSPSSSQPATSPAVSAISIFDMNNQKGITLIPEKKLAVTMEFKNVPPETMDKMKRQNFLEELKEAVAGERKELGEKKIGNQLARGYRCQAPSMQQVTMDIWVDAATGNPLRVEETLPEGMMEMGKSKITMTDFVLNPKLDDSLFDVNVPQGYSVLMNQAVDFNVREEDLIKWLGTLAEYCGGVFPKDLAPQPETFKKWKPQTSPPKSQPSEAEMKALIKEIVAKMQPWQKAMAFQMRTMQGGEFVYAGDGVKLGDKATPILWYKAKDAKAYRVIYGDLHAEDAETAPARPASQPASATSRPSQ